MFCPSCGTQMPDSADFCMHCGVNIKQIREGRALVNPPAPNPTPDLRNLNGQQSVAVSGDKPWDHDILLDATLSEDEPQEQVLRFDANISGDEPWNNNHPSPPPYPAPASYPAPYPAPSPYPVPPAKASARNVVGFVFSLLGSLAVIIAFIAAFSAKKTIKISSYKYDYDVDESIIAMSIVLAVFGFVFGLIGLLTSPKNQKRTGLGTCGLALGIGAMCVSVITVIVSLILNS